VGEVASDEAMNADDVAQALRLPCTDSELHIGQRNSTSDRHQGPCCMNLFCFASTNRENIRRGIDACMWAVANVSPPAVGKARKHFGPGSLGLLYCSETHSFTTPFIATSTADPHAIVDHIWPETWYLPFSINPLGDLRRQVSKELAKVLWRPQLINYVPPRTVFSPVDIIDQDWQSIQKHLVNLIAA
jgi:hypothetical protein